MSIACPKCNDENVQRLSVAFESGISDVHTSTSGTAIGFGRGGIGIGIGSSKTQGTAQTALSQRAAPPQKASYLRIVKYWFIGALIGAVVLGILNVSKFIEDLFGYGIFIVAAFALLQAFSFNKNQWPGLFQKWQQSYICLKCGNIFED